jgi:hypothetical protein
VLVKFDFCFFEKEIRVGGFALEFRKRADFPWTKLRLYTFVHLKSLSEKNRRLEERDLESSIQRHFSQFVIDGEIRLVAQGQQICVWGDLVIQWKPIKKRVMRKLRHLVDQLLLITADSGQADIVIRCLADSDDD